MGLLFVPVYLKTLGPEGYGLVGFQATLTATLAILDLGFGAAGTREMAILNSNSDDSKLRAKNLVLSLEVLYWIISILAGIVLYLLSPTIVGQWLNSKALDPEVQIIAIRLMALTFIFQFPIGLYSGCLLGLGRQVGLNFINGLAAAFRFGGAALVCLWTQGKLSYFFLWQLAVVILTVVGLRFYLMRPFRNFAKGIPNAKSLLTVGRFALGVSGINFISLILTQIDKIVLSKILSLEKFGYYTLGWTVAGIIYRISTPVFNTLYPKLVYLFNQAEPTQLNAFYQKSAQTMALAIIPLSMFLAFFSQPIIELWLQNSTAASEVQLTARFLIMGSMINGLMMLPYGLQLASGWTRLSFYLNALSLVIIVPLVIYFALEWGNAAMAWPIVNLGFMLVGINLMHKRLLKEAKIPWFIYSVIVPIVVALIILVPITGLGLLPDGHSVLTKLLLLSLIGILIFSATAFALPFTRSQLRMGNK